MYINYVWVYTRMYRYCIYLNCFTYLHTFKFSIIYIYTHFLCVFKLSPFLLIHHIIYYIPHLRNPAICLVEIAVINFTYSCKIPGKIPVTMVTGKIVQSW